MIPDLRLASAAFFAQAGPGPGEAGNGDADVGVRRQRVLDQAVEHRIVVEAPPISGRLRIGDDASILAAMTNGAAADADIGFGT